MTFVVIFLFEKDVDGLDISYGMTTYLLCIIYNM